MSDLHSNNLPGDDADDRGDLDWSEFDWERYLREQDAAVEDYWHCYQAVGDRPDRLDETARRLGWEPVIDEETDLPEGEDPEIDDGPYTVHRNRVYIATAALLGRVQAAWQDIASRDDGLPAGDSAALAAALRRVELATVMGLQALDIGDRTLGVAQLKRALAHLNAVFALLPPTEHGAGNPAAAAFSAGVRPWLFDVREIFLRVLYECRQSFDPDGEDDAET